MMTPFAAHLEAIQTATELIELFPDGTVWALEVTNEDNGEAPSVLNIFYQEEDFAESLITLLELDNPYDQGQSFTSWRYGCLHISLIYDRGTENV